MEQTGNHTQQRIANGLGWFSVGLGLAEVVAPGRVASLIGVRDKPYTRKVLRTYGVRELTAGIGILMQRRPAGWVWGRVAGDMLDLASLGSALKSDATNKTRAITASAAILGVTALDVVCGQQLTARENGSAETYQNGKAQQKHTVKVTRTIIVGRSPEEAYNYWRNLENLPKFMDYVESVRSEPDGRLRWVAKGPGGRTIEWIAEIVSDQPGREIAWRSVEGSSLRNSGSVRFENAPGNRGTLVRVEIDYSPHLGFLPSALVKMLKLDPARRIEHDLRNFKQMLEVGEVTRSEAGVHPGMHPAHA